MLVMTGMLSTRERPIRKVREEAVYPVASPEMVSWQRPYSVVLHLDLPGRMRIYIRLISPESGLHSDCIAGSCINDMPDWTAVRPFHARQVIAENTCPPLHPVHL